MASKLTVVSRLGRVEMLRTQVDSVEEAQQVLVQRLTDHLARPDAPARRTLMEARAIAAAAVPGTRIVVIEGWELEIGFNVPRPKKATLASTTPPTFRKRKATP